MHRGCNPVRLRREGGGGESRCTPDDVLTRTGTGLVVPVPVLADQATLSPDITRHWGIHLAFEDLDHQDRPACAYARFMVRPRTGVTASGRHHQITCRKSAVWRQGLSLGIVASHKCQLHRACATSTTAQALRRPPTVHDDNEALGGEGSQESAHNHRL